MNKLGPTFQSLFGQFGNPIFIETGTWGGDGVFAAQLSGTFNRIISFEIDDRLYGDCKTRFANASIIELICGDSAKLLPSLLANINEPVTFWLDAHCSGADTGGYSRDRDRTIIGELEAIANFEYALDSVIIIDDVPMFGTDYSAISLWEILCLLTKIFETPIIRTHQIGRHQMLVCQRG